MGGGDEKYEIMMKIFFCIVDDYFFYCFMLFDRNDIFMFGNVNIEGGKLVLDFEIEYFLCYIGGIFVFGGKFFFKKVEVVIGEKFVCGCVYVYKFFFIGLMFECFNMVFCFDC